MNINVFVQQLAAVCVVPPPSAICSPAKLNTVSIVKTVTRPGCWEREAPFTHTEIEGGLLGTNGCYSSTIFRHSHPSPLLRKVVLWSETILVPFRSVYKICCDRTGEQ